MSISSIPVVVEEEAARRVAALNMHRELEVMFEWVRNNVPDLQAIRLTHGLSKIPVLANLVVIVAHRHVNPEKPPTDLVEWDYACWKVQHLPHPICANVILSCAFWPLVTA
jgi:hypothetical protein